MLVSDRKRFLLVLQSFTASNIHSHGSVKTNFGHVGNSTISQRKMITISSTKV